MEGEVSDGASHLRRAEDALRAGDLMRAAAAYAAAGDATPFEATALGFLDRGEDDALALYLRSRLDAADAEREPETVTKLAAWLADLHVSRVCGAKKGTSGFVSATKDLRLFFAAHGSRLDVQSTKSLLEEYKLWDDCAHFLQSRGAIRESIDVRFRNKDITGVLRTLRNGNLSPEEVMDVASQAFQINPTETTLFLSKRTAIVTLGGDENEASSLVAKLALNVLTDEKYLRSNESSVDTSIRPNAIALLRQTEYVTPATRRGVWRSAASKAVCAGFGVEVASKELEKEFDNVRQSELLKIQEDAALDQKMLREMREDREFDGDDYDNSEDDASNTFEKLAIENRELSAERVSSSALAAATSRAVSACNLSLDKQKRSQVVQTALDLVKESNGDLSVEFILKCLPDSVTVDEVRDATLAELALYAQRTKSCLDEMKHSTSIETSLRNQIDDINDLDVKIPWNEPCCVCGLLVTAAPATYKAFASSGKNVETVLQKSPLQNMFVFPCGMAFHSACLLQEVLPMMSTDKRRACLDLLAITRAPLPKQLRVKCKEHARAEKEKKEEEGDAGMSIHPEEATTSKESSKSQSKSQSKKPPSEQLEDLLSEECPFCGDMQISMIDKPFVRDDETGEIESWRIP